MQSIAAMDVPACDVVGHDGALRAVHKESSMTASTASPISTRSPSPTLSEDLPMADGNTEGEGGEWEHFSVEQWKDAVYCSGSFFAQLSKDTKAFINEMIDTHARGERDQISLLEVGCGTGEVLVPFHGQVKHVIGTDINPHFIKHCNDQIDAAHQHSVTHVVCDVTTMDEHLRADAVVGPWLRDTKCVPICVGNTIGVLPEGPVRDAAYQQMAELAGEEGVAVMVYWNGAQFEHAVRNFYAPNKKLCGGVENADIDWQKHTMTTCTGYSTKWTTLEEAKSKFASYGLQVLEAREQGNGVLVAFRKAAA